MRDPALLAAWATWGRLRQVVLSPLLLAHVLWEGPVGLRCVSYMSQKVGLTLATHISTVTDGLTL